MKKLVFDIETIGETFSSMDEITQNSLTQQIKKRFTNKNDLSAALDEIKNQTGLSPLTGEIVAIGLLDIEENKGAVYYQNPENKETQEKNGIKYKPYSEKKMLEKFWKIVQKTNQLISFNGRGFDVPFLMIRSAIHGIRPSVNLMPYRYAHHYETNHLDLFDYLNFLGAYRGKGGLHLWCRAFNIESPKSKGISGGDVQELFKNKNYLKIAEYNVDDLLATRELYRKWKKYLAF